MPELPEVETIVRRFRPLVEKRRIISFKATWPRQIQPSIAQVRRAILNQTISGLERRGKYIVMHLEDGSCVLLHMKMSGRLEWAADDPAAKHVRARFGFVDDQALLFCDARKFGRIRHAGDFLAATAHLGPEPLAGDFTGNKLATMLSGRKGRIKSLLLDQTFVAGLGNIYTDEALHRAGIHPLRPANAISLREAGRLRNAIRTVLRSGIRHCGTSLDWIYPGGNMQDYLRVYGRSGQPCPRCGRDIQSMRVGGRSTHFCIECQPVIQR